MANPDEEVHIRDTEASAGSKEGVGRWVLIFGTGITIILLFGVAMIGGFSQGDVEEEATVSGAIQSVEDDDSDTDQVLGMEDGAGARPIAEPQQPDTPLSTIPNTPEGE